MAVLCAGQIAPAVNFPGQLPRSRADSLVTGITIGFRAQPPTPTPVADYVNVVRQWPDLPRSRNSLDKALIYAQARARHLPYDRPGIRIVRPAPDHWRIQKVRFGRWGGGGIPSKKFRLRLKSRRILLSYAPLNVLKPTCLHKGCSYFFTFKQICIFPPISDTAEEQFAPDAPTPPLISKCTRHEPSDKHAISHWYSAQTGLVKLLRRIYGTGKKLSGKLPILTGLGTAGIILPSPWPAFAQTQLWCR